MKAKNSFNPGDIDPQKALEIAKANNPHLSFACRHLRTKTMFYGYNRENALSIGPACNTQTFWCVMSGTFIGPDGDVAHRNECGTHRSCCNK